jgi:hypothetical protein
MPLDHLSIDRITEADLQALIEAGVAEGRDIDFKVESWGTSDPHKKEFLADVSSLANTVGGHIVVGMREEGGIARELVGVEVDPDKERLRLEQLARDGLQPRIMGLQIAAVKVGGGRHALVIRIPRSWSPPHRVTAQGSSRFWARAGAGKYEPDVDQLRELFAVAPTLAERIRDFRLDRIAKIKAGETPVPLAKGSALVLHIVPFAALQTGTRLALSEISAEERAFRPMRANAISGSRPNLEGLVVFTGNDGMARSAYTQIWRTGQVEAVRASIVHEHRAAHEQDPSPTVERRSVEERLTDGVERYLRGLRRLGITPPYALLVSLVGVRDLSYGRPTREEIEDREAELRRFDRDVIAVGEVLIEGFPATWDQQVVASLLRPAFDEIANAAGLCASPGFDATGRWLPGKQH